MTLHMDSDTADELARRAVESDPLWRPTPGEQACMDVQRAMAERKPREVEVVNLDFRKPHGGTR